MKTLCATWVESVFGAESARFEARFTCGNIGVSATFNLSDQLHFAVTSAGGRASGITTVSSPAEAHVHLTATAGRLVEQHLDRLRNRPDYRSELAARQPLGGYGVEASCTACAGQGRVKCWACNGTGRVTCSACGGAGVRSCGSCYGSGSRCVTVQTPFGYTTQYVSCGACSGGSVMCYCGGYGSTVCFTCQAGMISCNACFGSGYVTFIHSAQLAISVTTEFRVVDAPDAFVRQAARSAPEAISSHTKLNAPGQRPPRSRAISYEGNCAFEDGELMLAGCSTRIVSIGAAGAAVTAARPLDGVCFDYRKRLKGAAGTNLLSLLAFADGNRLAATQVLKAVRDGRPKSIRVGIERRGLASQTGAEQALTDAVLSRDFQDSCIAAVAASVDLHVAAFAARLRSVYEQAFGRLLVGAAVGLPLMFAFLLPQLSAFRSDRAIQLTYLGWIGIVALICGLLAAARAVPLHRAERRLLSERPTGEAIPTGGDKRRAASAEPSPDG